MLQFHVLCPFFLYLSILHSKWLRLYVTPEHAERHASFDRREQGNLLKQVREGRHVTQMGEVELHSKPPHRIDTELSSIQLYYTKLNIALVVLQFGRSSFTQTLWI